MSTKTTKFIQDFPAFPLGDYQVNVEHNIDSKSGSSVPKKSYTSTLDFQVKSSRYTLESDAIVQTYPVNNEQFAPAGMMPHVVFKHRTLPWQRKLFTKQQTDTTPLGTGLPSPKQINDYAPWLGVLLFEENEGIAKPVSRKVSAIKGDDTILTYPFLPDTVDADETCMTIDIPIDLFNETAPSGADLYYLGHAREVDASNKPVNIGGKPLTQTSAVMGNRVPLQGLHSTAYLVSLEHMYDYLPDSVDYSPSKKIPSTVTTVRLIVYKSWTFYTEVQHKSFDAYFDTLDYGKASVGLQIPTETTQPAWIQNALQLGYLPLNHHTRMGADTASWYRGPCLPFDGNPIENNASTLSPSPDSLMRYDPDTGLFDVSYAAAWQLGQLLMLQNKKAATALYDWKKEITKAALDEITRSNYNKANPAVKKIFTPGGNQVEDVASKIVAPTIKKLI